MTDYKSMTEIREGIYVKGLESPTDVMAKYGKKVLATDGEYERAEKFIEAKRETLDWIKGDTRAGERKGVITEIIKLVQENHKGTFTDDAGNDCWYIDDLVRALQHMLKNEVN